MREQIAPGGAKRWKSGRQACPPLSPPSLEYEATASGRHTGAVTVSSGAFQVARLESSFHGKPPLGSWH